MPRPSDPASRVMAILNLLGEYPRQGFRLSDIIRGLGLNRATCHSLANELVRGGYLYRTGARTYMLGPALTRLGRVALTGRPIEIATREMRALALRYGAACYLLARERDEVVVLERAITPALIDWPVPIGRRWPLNLASSAPLVAWGDTLDIDHWFTKIIPKASGLEVQRIREGIAFARENGYYIYVTPVGSAAEERGPQANSCLQFPAVERQSAISSAASYHLRSIVAPVMAQEARVEFFFFLTGIDTPRLGNQIAAIGEDLKSACGRIGAFFS